MSGKCGKDGGYRGRICVYGMPWNIFGSMKKLTINCCLFFFFHSLFLSHHLWGKLKIFPEKIERMQLRCLCVCVLDSIWRNVFLYWIPGGIQHPSWKWGIGISLPCVNVMISYDGLYKHISVGCFHVLLYYCGARC